MSELDPAQDPEYAAALDRFLDGLLDDPAPAGAQVRADTDAIAKALGLIGGALAADGGVTAAAGAVPPVAAGGATVVQMSSWRSKLNPRVLAAAASLVLVVGVGVPLSMSATSGSDSDDAATAMDAPNSQAESATAGTAPGAAPAPLAPGVATLSGDAFGADTSAAAPGAVAGSATTTDTGTTAAGGAARDAQALEDAQSPADPAAKNGSGAASKPAANAAFDNAVACARAIFVGNITSVQPSPDGAHFKVTFLVTEWIAPASGPVSATYEVYGSTVNSPGVDEHIIAGQRRLFVVPASPEERMYAYREKDWPDTRKQIKAVRDERAGQGC